MTREPGNVPLPPIASRGFVVAMCAKAIGRGKPAFEWIIVSRWGTAGEFLSIGWTGQAVTTEVAPIDLAPAQSVLAVRREHAGAWAPATFELAGALPDRVTVAGAFLPAEGYVRLYGKGVRLRLRSSGHCTLPEIRPAWNIEASRSLWIGEFIEAAICQCGPPGEQNAPPLPRT